MTARRPRGRVATSAPVAPARRAALRLLRRVDDGGAYVARLGADPAVAALGPADRRHVTELVAGITRQRRWLDFLVEALAGRPLDRLSGAVRGVLHIGLYELLVVATPAHAAIHEAVALARAAGQARAAGLVNAVLRQADRRRDDLPAPDTGDAVEDLAIRASHPTWLVRRWVERFGRADAEALLAWNNRRPVHCLRVNLLRATVADVTAALDARGIAWSPSPRCDDVLHVPRLQPVLASGLIEQGLAVVQDESAAWVVRALDPRAGETVVDACAAPGGKALYAAARMGDHGRVVACDLRAERLAPLTRAAEAQGITIVETLAGDFRDLVARSAVPVADRVLLDAPCTGSGVLAKRADLRWRRAPEDLDALCALQRALLDAAARSVRPGGCLVYGTCSIEPEENEAQVAAFLARHAEFALEPVGDAVPPELVTPAGCLATLPQRHGMDGAFAARLRRATP